MGRRWLVVAALCVAADASADPSTCSCSTPFVLPARDAVVPTNAKIWLFDADDLRGWVEQDRAAASRVDGRFEGKRVVAFTPALVSNASYTFNTASAVATFTTTTGPDVTSPAVPTVTGVSIILNDTRRDGRSAVSRLSFDGSFPADAPMVRVVIEDALGETSFILTTPSRHDLCDPGMWLAPGPARVTFRAVDLAGNESASVTLPITIVSAVPRSSPCISGRWTASTSAFGGFVVGAIVFVGGFVGLLVIFVWRRGRSARLDAREPEAISLLVAEHLARGARSRDLLIAAIISAAIVGCVLDDARPVAVGIVAVLVYLSGAATAGRALRLLEVPSASAELRATRLTVRAGSVRATLNVTARGIARARRAAVPTSIAR